MSIHEPTNGAYVHSLEPVAVLRDFPAMPNLAAEHIAAVRKHLNGGRTTAELNELANGRFPQRAPFTPGDIRSIRTRRASGEYLASIARDFHVHANAIGAIARRESYRWVR